MSEIYKAIPRAMQEIGVVAKDRINQQQRFSYRGIDDVMNALHPVLVKHGLFLTPEVLEHKREERTTKSGGNLIYSVMKLKYTLYAQDGSSVSATVIGEGMDSADKSSNKAMAVGMKYALFQLFCIPTEEMGNDDPDRATPPDSTPTNIAPIPDKETPPDSLPIPFNPKEARHAFMERLGIDTDMFVRMRQALIEGGVVADIPSEQMTEANWNNLFAAIESNLGDGK